LAVVRTVSRIRAFRALVLTVWEKHIWVSRSKVRVVGGAVIKVGSILPPVLFAFAPVVIHLGSAVGTEHKAGQGIGNAGGICPAHRPFHLLGELPGFRANDGLV